MASSTTYTDASIGCGSGCGPIQALINWTKDGFASTNVAYATTYPGDTNTVTWLGAVNGTDTSPPAVTMTSPTNGSTIGGTVTVTATSTDNFDSIGQGVQGVKFYYDSLSNQIGSEITATSAPSTYSTTWDVSALSGAHTIFAVSRDLAGNTTTSASISVTVQNSTTSTPPTSLAATVKNGSVSLTWGAPSSNGGSAITDYFIEYKDSSVSSWSTFSHTASTSTSATISSLVNSSYDFRVSAINALGTSSPSSVLSASVGSGGGGGGGSVPPVSTSIIPSTFVGLQYGNSAFLTARLVTDNDTFYLIQNGQKQGVTSPGILYTYGFNFNQAVPVTTADLALPDGPLLLPGNGSLVKSKEDLTVYFVSNQTRYAFTSATVFHALGFSFSSVLIVTDSELQALPRAANLSDGISVHLPGTDINVSGTIYYIAIDNQRHPYISLGVYNSWHRKNDFSMNDFSMVVKANAADLSLPVGEAVTAREMQ
ncbi:MAG: fibronectin type III domain-containing protein [Patescibacteria group bacterium]|nr:fibronectin type III domain-containing protein [Patescibacteria group bacterium]